MTAIEKDVARIQGIAHETYLSTGGLLALLDASPTDSIRLAAALDKVASQYESGALEVRSLCERHRPFARMVGKKPAAQFMEVAGTAAITRLGWVHLTLNGLLPHCTRETPAYLTDTITRLLDELAERQGVLPWFTTALLVVDEHCDFDSHRPYDQDNKGWKAIPNAMKGRLFEDDNQFTLSLALLTTKSEEECCHIYLLPVGEADDFFYMRGEKLPI